MTEPREPTWVRYYSWQLRSMEELTKATRADWRQAAADGAVVCFWALALIVAMVLLIWGWDVGPNGSRTEPLSGWWSILGGGLAVMGLSGLALWRYGRLASARYERRQELRAVKTRGKAKKKAG
ncbi:hypothetical protein [Shimia sp. Alg240-R146]|uniref:hypothetical protein n=1 Tax=Shimia sp. Alg240-R146 TaxID=2993449 RepID=UPI0022E25111|nr:hypothetical protein [Shimia sp. Alg240-R146]